MIDTGTDLHYKDLMRTIKNILALLLVLSTAAACAGGPFQRNTPTPEFTATSTEAPTATPTPAPTATPTPQPAARLDKGNTAFLNGEYDTALSAYQNVLDYSQDADLRAKALVMMGRITLLQGDSTKALEQFRQAAASDGSADPKSEAHYYLGTIYDSLQRYADAAAEYDAYLQLKPGPIAAYIYTLAGDAYANAGMNQKAVEAYQNAVKLPDADPSALNLKIARNTAILGDDATALALYDQVFNTTASDYTRATVDLLVGQIHLKQGDAQAAYDRFQDAVNSYPRSYDSYSALVALVNDNVPVSDLNRGIVDYYAGQYGVAADVLNTYIKSTPTHDGTAHYYRAMALNSNGDFQGAATEWDELIRDHPNDRFYATAWDELAYIQWSQFGKYDMAAQTLLNFIANSPKDSMAPSLLFEAGRIYERNNELDAAVTVWDRLPSEYPDTDYSYMGIYFAGITRFRQQRYADAAPYFQRSLLLGTDSTEKAGAYFWMGKTAHAAGDEPTAQDYWQDAIKQDPTGYYSERARDLVTGREAYQPCKVLDLAVDLDSELPGAKAWMTQTFSLPADTNYDDLGSVESDSRIQRAGEYWRLGLYEKAQAEVDSYTADYQKDALTQFRLGRWLLQNNMYRPAILATRQVLTLAGLDDNGTLTAPLYFNHVRFGPYYRELITKAAVDTGLDPLLIYSVIRQESMFDPNISSSAGADGLMQMVPATAREVSSQSGWPPVFLDDDIFRPQVSIALGSYYLKQQIRLQDGDIYAGLAAYNGGPGNASGWKELANGDPDLYLEVVRFKETRNYLRAILEIFNLYKAFYCR
jgi:soluble lytic murein transglycosylase